MKNNVFSILLAILTIFMALCSLFQSAMANTYALPDPKNTLMGNGSGIILPSLPRQGIIINLPEMRLYYFPKNSNIVMSYPIGIGKVGKTVPISQTYVSKKVINPIWIPTKDIRAYNRAQGIILPAFIPPGPDNPLGPYAIYLGVSEYRIHSTIYPNSIGRRASFGCIRMTEEDIKNFFPLVKPKTSVNIVDMPTKIGWQDNKLFIEAHPPLEESPSPTASYGGMIQLIQQSIQNQSTFIDWQLVDYLADTKQGHDGKTHEVGVKIPQQQEVTSESEVTIPSITNESQEMPNHLN